MFLKNDKWCWAVSLSSIYVLSNDLEKQISKCSQNFKPIPLLSDKSTSGRFSYCLYVSFVHQTCLRKEKICDLEFCNGLIQQDSSWFLPNLLNLFGGFYVVPMHGRIMCLLLFPMKFVIAAIKYKKLSKLLDVSRVFKNISQWGCTSINYTTQNWKVCFILFFFWLTS